MTIHLLKNKIIDANNTDLAEIFSSNLRYTANLHGGLFAIGGLITPPWLTEAYRFGVFPYYIENNNYHWYCPRIRGVMLPQFLWINRTLRKFLKHQHYQIKINHNKEKVMRACATVRREEGTWITDEYILNYPKMPNFISIEVYNSNDLVGGLYGLVEGLVFCGESQFSIESNTSKLAMIALCSWCYEHGIKMIDCQLCNEYLVSMGCGALERPYFLSFLETGLTMINHDPKIFEPQDYQFNLNFQDQTIDFNFSLNNGKVSVIFS